MVGLTRANGQGPAARWDQRIEQAVASLLTAPDVPPEPVARRAVWTVVDVVAAAAAASSWPELRTAAERFPLAPGTATLLGLGREASPPHAVLFNTTLAIAQEIEEGHNQGGHVGASVVTAALAAAEEAGAPGRQVVSSVWKAYEVTARVEAAFMSVRARLAQAAPWVMRNPHSTWAVLGAALAAALVRGLPAEALREVWRMGLNTAVINMWDPFADGPSARNFTAGLSAQTGVTIAQMAEAGVVGSEQACLRVLGAARDLVGEALEESFAGLGREPEILRNYFKFAPSCRHTHAPLDALASIRDRVDVDQIERIDVGTYSSAVPMSHQRAVNATSGKFSIPYCLAACLVLGRVDFDAFTPDRLASPAIAALAERVFVQADPEFDRRFPDRWGARVTVTHRDGRQVSAETDLPTGDWRHGVTEQALAAKWRWTLAQRYPVDRARAIVDAWLELENADSVQPLTRLLA